MKLCEQLTQNMWITIGCSIHKLNQIWVILRRLDYPGIHSVKLSQNRIIENHFVRKNSKFRAYVSDFKWFMLTST